LNLENIIGVSGFGCGLNMCWHVMTWISVWKIWGPWIWRSPSAWTIPGVMGFLTYPGNSIWNCQRLVGGLTLWEDFNFILRGSVAQEISGSIRVTVIYWNFCGILFQAQLVSAVRTALEPSAGPLLMAAGSRLAARVSSSWVTAKFLSSLFPGVVSYVQETHSLSTTFKISSVR
jgi:hypothetical protein